jgi:hypothetical protein
MKKLFTTIITLVILGLSLHAMAEDTLADTSIKLRGYSCEAKLTNDHNRDFSFYSFNRDEVSHLRDFGPDHLAQSIVYIRYLLNKVVGCQNDEVNFGKGPQGRAQSRCSSLSPKVDFSKVCYVETNLGYFLVHTDFMENITIQFHRWD